MKKLISGLILMIFLAGVTVFGQNKPDEILAPGEPPLTRAMVENLRELFEWSLGGRMTPEEQNEFARQRINEWQTNDRKSIENLQSLLRLRDQLMNLPNDKRAEFQQKFQPAVLGELQKTPADETSKLLIKVYNRAHSGVSSSDPSAISSQPNEPAGSFNAGDNSAIVGEWTQGYTSTIGFTNGSSGVDSAGTDQVGMLFEPDGTFKSAWYVRSSMYGCTVTAFGYRTGIYQVSGSTVFITEKTSSLSSKDSCHPDRNSEKNPPLKKSKYVFNITRAADGEKLVLKTNSGDDVFDRNTGKSLLAG